MEEEIVERKGSFVTNEMLCVRGGDAALPKLLWDFFVLPIASVAGCGVDYTAKS